MEVASVFHRENGGKNPWDGGFLAVKQKPPVGARNERGLGANEYPRDVRCIL